MNDLWRMFRTLLERGLVIEVRLRPTNVTAFTVACPDCDWSAEHATAEAAARALRSHRQHCPSRAEYDSFVDEVRSWSDDEAEDHSGPTLPPAY